MKSSEMYAQFFFWILSKKNLEKKFLQHFFSTIFLTFKTKKFFLHFFFVKSSETYAKKILWSALFEWGGRVCGSLPNIYIFGILVWLGFQTTNIHRFNELLMVLKPSFWIFRNTWIPDSNESDFLSQILRLRLIKLIV